MQYKVCSRCVLDSSVKDIVFDDDGFCNYCNDYLIRCAHIVNKEPGKRKAELDSLINKIFSTIFWSVLRKFTGLQLPKGLAVMRIFNRKFVIFEKK